MKTFGLFLLLATTAVAKPTVRIGSKSFTESYVLAEIAAQLIERAGEAEVERRFGLGQTGIAYEALTNKKIDLYPEYTGTIAEVLLKDPSIVEMPALRRALAPLNLAVSDSLGFNNTYALAMKRTIAQNRALETLSDLKGHPDLRAGFSHEFIERKDCYPKIQNVYAPRFKELKGLSHALAYEALENGAVDVVDIYSTDAKVEKMDLKVLADDKKIFPDYRAVFLTTAAFQREFPRSWQALRTLEGKFTEKEMTRLNAQAEIDKKDFAAVARDYLGHAAVAPPTRAARLGKLTLEHLTLVLVSLFASILIGVPLALLASEYRKLGQGILMLSGVIQTIPSLALLCFLIPLFGIGTLPALVALFLYGLLPIVRSGYTGFISIDPRHLEVARALGLTRRERLRLIEFPLASPQLLAGIKTSLIISIGTATLAALIGAGGYGVPIVAGLALNDIPTILEGAIPAAVMALVAHALFEAVDWFLIPKGLRQALSPDQEIG